MAAKGRRHSLVDALRVLALAGVFAVNFTSYSDSPVATPLGLVNSDADWPALLAHGLVAGLFQAKAYPLLAFLFGYSFALSLRGLLQRGRTMAQALAHRRSRMLRLLALGLIHGCLIYMGDILSAYSVCGLILLFWAPQRMGRLLPRLRLLAVLWCLMTVLGGFSVLFNPPGAIDPTAAPTLGSILEFGPWWSLNMISYLRDQIGSLPAFLPELLSLTLGGLVAGRLRLLEGRRRWRPLLRQIAGWGLGLGLPLNVAYGMAAMLSASHGGRWDWTLVMFSALIGPLLSAGVVAAAALAWQRGTPGWLLWLSAAGRNTLSMYIGLSVVMLVLLSGIGAGWGPRLGADQALLLALFLYALATVFAAWAGRHGINGPLERWMSRAGPVG